MLRYVSRQKHQRPRTNKSQCRGSLGSARRSMSSSRRSKAGSSAPETVATMSEAMSNARVRGVAKALAQIVSPSRQSLSDVRKITRASWLMILPATA